MDAVRLAALAVALGTASPARADAVDRWRAPIAEASARFGVPAVWIEDVIRAESRGLTIWQGRPITSRAGAMGLMQLMPATWAEMRARLGLGMDPYDPHDNILAGSFYLRLMYARFGYPGLFAAYNAGPARYAELLAVGEPLPGETRAYLVAVAPRTPFAGAATTNPRVDTIFFAVGAAGWPATAERAPAPPLFVALHGAAPTSAGNAP